MGLKCIHKYDYLQMLEERLCKMYSTEQLFNVRYCWLIQGFNIWIEMGFSIT